MCVHGRNITYVRTYRFLPADTRYIRIWYIIRTWYHTKTKISRTHAHFFSPLKPRLEHTHRFFFLDVAIRNSLRSNYAVFFYPKLIGTKITINKYFEAFNIHPWFAANTKQIYLYSSQTRRATTFERCPPGDTCSTCASIPRSLPSGGAFYFRRIYLVVRSTYQVRIRAYMRRRRVLNHKPVWELHTSASTGPLLLSCFPLHRRQISSDKHLHLYRRPPQKHKLLKD